jgi:LytS/YehU family sensor histidine kinase
MKRTLIATVVVFLAWDVLDFLIHGVLLQGTYAATPELWRPQAEMKMALMYLTVLVSALCFCTIYAKWVFPKSIQTGFLFGLWFGIAVGVGMGFGTYSVQPIPYVMALTWFFGTVVEGAVAGLLAAALIRD